MCVCVYLFVLCVCVYVFMYLDTPLGGGWLSLLFSLLILTFFLDKLHTPTHTLSQKKQVLLQFEDFPNFSAFGLLAEWEKKACSFNDDIQVRLVRLFSLLYFGANKHIHTHKFNKQNRAPPQWLWPASSPPSA